MKTGNLNDAAYSLLKERILNGALAPNSQISEPMLSAEFNLSKAPVRNALLRLQHEGLIRSVPRQGYVVSKLTAQDALDLLELRSLLETDAAFHATGRIDQEFVRYFESEFDKGYVYDDADSVLAFIKLNRDHRTRLAEVAGNARAAKAVSEVNFLLSRYTRLSITTFDWTKISAERIRRLNAALLAGDPEKAKAVASEHLYISAAAILYALNILGEDIRTAVKESGRPVAELALAEMKKLDMTRWAG